MNELNYRDMELISLNVAGWNWRITDEKWETRLRRICSYIKGKMSNPLVIALQEVQLSGGKYLQVIETEFPDFFVVLPKGYKNQPKSVMSMLLINKALCKSYSVSTLDNLEDSLRYNYVTINTHIEGLCFRILNTNVPQNSFDEKNSAGWYRKEREELRGLFVERIKELAGSYRNEQDMKMIIMGDLNALPDSEFIDSLAYTYINRPMVDAVNSSFKNTYTWKDYKTNVKHRLDYILYSNGMLCDTGAGAKITVMDNTTICQKLSDHAVVIGGLKFDID